jgi:hypothetical protein
VAIEELLPGLHRWTAPHPDWEAESEPGSPADWAQLVGSVALETEHCVVLVDPLVPDELWPELDELVAGRPVAVVTTVRWHGRSGDAARARYHSADPPPEIAFVDFPAADERMVWIEQHHALVPGDRLLGDDGGGLRLCPESWLNYIGTGLTLDELRRLLDPLLDLPVELVLVSHGEPVLSGGRDAIRRALAG